MNEKLELLKTVTGRDFETITCNNKTNLNFFKCEDGEAFVIEKEYYDYYLEEATLQEISYMENKKLLFFLDTHYNNEELINLKELSKTNHTILTDRLINKSWFIEDSKHNNLILDESSLIQDDNYIILFARN